MFDRDSHNLDSTKFHYLLRDLFNIKNKWKNVLYIDIPFCEQKCLYCAYFRGVASNQNRISNFLNNVLLPQIDLFSDVFKNRPFYQVQLGGGTPTLINPAKLERIFKRIPNFRSIPVKIIEVSPYSFTDDHIDLLAAFDFTNISIGVQSFSNADLKKQNRPPINKNLIKHFCRKIEQAGMISNVDLMFFLDGDKSNLKRERDDLEYALSTLRPVEIVIHSKYGIVSNNQKLHKPLTELIKEMLAKYPEYICVNSSLKKSDMVNDPCIRLMRDRFDYVMSFQAVKVHPANFGYNTLALGDCLDSSPLYSSFYNYLILYNKYVAARVINWDWSSDRYEEFVRVRKKHKLPYHKFNKDDFFFNSKDKKKIESIVAKLQSMMPLDKYLYQKILRSSQYRIVNIVKSDRSLYEIEFGCDDCKERDFIINISSSKPEDESYRTSSGYYLFYDRKTLNKNQRQFVADLASSI